MFIKFENNLLSFGLLLMLFQLMVRAAVVKSLNNSVISHQKEEVIPLTAANVRNNVIMSSSHVDHRNQPYYHGPPSYSHGRFNRQEPVTYSSEPHLRKGDEYEGDQRLPVEDPDYFDYGGNPSGNSGGYRQHPRQRSDQSRDERKSNDHRPTKKPKRIYKAIERVYYYPDSDSGPSRNKDVLNQMKEYIPDEPIDDDSNDENDHELDPHDPHGEVDPRLETRKDYEQMNENPPRGEQEEPEELEEIYTPASDGTGAQRSIANDVKEFGREAVDEAKGFEKFLDNLRRFADNSEKEYSSPSEVLDSDHNANIGRDEVITELNPRYTDSMAAHTGADDRTRDYETVSNFGNPDEYESEKNSYQKQKDQIDGEQRGGHRYHKDRRRPRKSNRIPDEEYERRNKEVSGLIDSEPEEGEYLSNVDVVKQMKNSEKKYNTGVDPVYSSRRDFDEVTRLEKMIENVALLNKQKEKSASNSHDRSEGREGSESKTKITTVSKKDDNKDKS